MIACFMRFAGGSLLGFSIGRGAKSIRLASRHYLYLDEPLREMRNVVVGPQATQLKILARFGNTIPAIVATFSYLFAHFRLRKCQKQPRSLRKGPSLGAERALRGSYMGVRKGSSSGVSFQGVVQCGPSGVRGSFTGLL